MSKKYPTPTHLAHGVPPIGNTPEHLAHANPQMRIQAELNNVLDNKTQYTDDVLKELFQKSLKGEYFTIAGPNNQILKDHFGLCPGVLSSRALRELAQLGRGILENMKRTFPQEITPGIELNYVNTGSTYELQNKDGKTYVQFSSSQRKREEFPHYLLEESISQNIESWIPHGESFRFVDKIGETQSGKLYGEYTTTNRYLERDGTIPYWLIEESCAQAMMGSLRLQEGEGADYGTYGGIEIRPTAEFDAISDTVKSGSTIKCIGTYVKTKREVEFKYTCYINEKEYFSAIITGNLISKKVWERKFKNI